MENYVSLHEINMKANGLDLNLTISSNNIF